MVSGGARGVTAAALVALASVSRASGAQPRMLLIGRTALPDEPGFLAAARDQPALTRLLADRSGDPPEVLMPELARTAYRAVYSEGENRAGLVRALFFEVSGLQPETEEAAAEVIRGVVARLVVYLVGQMAEGRLRRMHPLLALQAFIGPILFHILTRSLAERVLRLDIEGEAAVTQLADTWLRAMATREEGSE